MICLDTNVAIAVINGDKRVLRRIVAAVAENEGLAISIIVLMELRYGAEHSARRDHNLERVETFIAGPVEVLTFDAGDAAEAAVLREELARRGKPIGPYDILIAAQARRRGAILATDNEREFGRITGLERVNWLRD